MVQLLAALRNKQVWTRGAHAVIQGLFCLFCPSTLGTKISLKKTIVRSFVCSFLHYPPKLLTA